jgi:hypothetical protein
MSQVPTTRRRQFQFGLSSAILAVATLAVLLAVLAKFNAISDERQRWSLLVKELELNGRYENARAEAWRNEAIKLRGYFADDSGFRQEFKAEKDYPPQDNPALNRERPRLLQ